MSHQTRGHNDAKDKLHIKVLSCDVANAEPNNPSKCAIAVAAMRTYKFDEFVVYRTVAYGLLPGSKKYLKWQNSNNVREIIEQYDINVEHTKKRLPKGGVVVTFLPLKKDLSTAYLRGDEKKQQRVTSYNKRKGKTKRSYRISDPLTLQGVRWGTQQKT